MKFRATKEQVSEIVANAVNASVARGMGFLHYDGARIFTAEDFLPDVEESPTNLNYDYVQGRMVKLFIREVEDGIWQTESGEARSDYQSWRYRYPTFKDLVTSIEGGVEIIEA